MNYINVIRNLQFFAMNYYLATPDVPVGVILYRYDVSVFVKSYFSLFFCTLSLSPSVDCVRVTAIRRPM